MLGRKKVDFKGTKNGIVLYYEKDLGFEELCDLIDKKLAKAKDFFKGAHMIGVDGPPLQPQQEERLTALIERRSGMKVLTLEPIEREPQRETTVAHLKFGAEDISFQEPTARAAQEPTVRTAQEPTVRTAQESVTVAPELPSTPDASVTVDAHLDTLPLIGDMVLGDKTVFHRGTLRSGKRIESKGHLIIIGDVNPGAEISAEGNIVVLGTLRGFAFAGSSGDDTRMIIALKLMPTQLRIGSKITRSPDDGTSAPSYPEVASVKNNQIIIEPLS